MCSFTQIINKVALHHIPAPSTVMFCQMAFSAFVAKGAGAVGLTEVDSLEWTKVTGTRI